MFWCLLILSLILFAISLIYFFGSFYGHSYQFLPPANDTENYRQKLLETYKGYEGGEELTEKYFNKYLYDYYNECSSANTLVNDLRSELLHKCNTFLILCTVPLCGTFLLFTLAGIDKNSVDKEYKVKVITPLMIENGNPPSQNQTAKIQTTKPLENKENINGQRRTKTATTSSSKTTEENNKRRHTNSTTSTKTIEE